jgi:hypothetical protein
MQAYDKTPLFASSVVARAHSCQLPPVGASLSLWPHKVQFISGRLYMRRAVVFDGSGYNSASSHNFKPYQELLASQNPVWFAFTLSGSYEISDFSCSVVPTFPRLGYYAAQVGSRVPMFRRNQQVQFPRSKQPWTALHGEIMGMMSLSTGMYFSHKTTRSKW